MSPTPTNHLLALGRAFGCPRPSASGRVLRECVSFPSPETTPGAGRPRAGGAIGGLGLMVNQLPQEILQVAHPWGLPFAVSRPIAICPAECPQIA